MNSTEPHSNLERQAMAEMQLPKMLADLRAQVADLRKVMGYLCSRCNNRTLGKITVVNGKRVCQHCL